MGEAKMLESEELEAEWNKKQAELTKKNLHRKVLINWNKFIRGLLTTIDGWKSYSEICIENRISIEEFPLEVQKLFIRFNPKAEFDFMLEDLFAGCSYKFLPAVLEGMLIKVDDVINNK